MVGVIVVGVVVVGVVVVAGAAVVVGDTGAAAGVAVVGNVNVCDGAEVGHTGRGRVSSTADTSTSRVGRANPHVNPTVAPANANHAHAFRDSRRLMAGPTAHPGKSCSGW